MNYFLLWLILGNIAYSLALTFMTYRLASKLKMTTRKIKRGRTFFIGVAGILLGPLAFFLIDYNTDQK